MHYFCYLTVDILTPCSFFFCSLPTTVPTLNPYAIHSNLVMCLPSVSITMAFFSLHMKTTVLLQLLLLLPPTILLNLTISQQLTNAMCTAILLRTVLRMNRCPMYNSNDITFDTLMNFSFPSPLKNGGCLRSFFFPSYLIFRALNYPISPYSMSLGESIYTFSSAAAAE